MHTISDPLHGLRIGCVAYLNARPLIEPYTGPVLLEHPSVLAAGLVRGDLDVALIPVYEALRHPEFPIVDGVSISSFGPVWSVFVAHREPLSELRTVRLDPASLTSANLCRVIFAEWVASRNGGCEMRKAEPGSEMAPVGPGEGRLLIGNQAIEFRERHGAAFQYLDFGEEWKRRTGLPFVFAVWTMRTGLPDAEGVAEALRGIAREGCGAIAEIAARQTTFSEAFALRYLTQNIRFGLGAGEKRGMERFRELLQKHRLLPADASASPRCL